MTKDFRSELTVLLNKHSIDVKLNVPDYILAQHISYYLDVLEHTIGTKDTWFDFKPFSFIKTELEDK